ncbi:hypothetical protein ACFQ6S_22845 [Streptomyces sp. NPDC056479]|uniref:hypothetical protein n=1 Tax=Streptomyces sp. NPDC056479 TaxID=3345832 RepID=UPI0036B7FCEB
MTTTQVQGAAPRTYCMTSLSTGGAGSGTAWGQQTAVRSLRDARFGNADIKSVEDDSIDAHDVATRR